VSNSILPFLYVISWQEQILVDEVSPQNKNLNVLIRIKYLNLFLYISELKPKNLVVRTKFYWSCSSGPALLVRTAS
jgi:hypothetical protein